MPPPRLGALVLLVASASSLLSSAATPTDAAAPSFAWGVLPPSVKVPLRGLVLPDVAVPVPSAKTIDIAAQRGECEAVQVWVRSESTELRNVSLRVATLSAPAASATLSDGHWQALQQLYVNTTAHNTTTMYEPSTPGWHADPLFPTDTVPRVPNGLTQPLWLEVCVPTTATPALYTGSFALLVDKAAPTLIPVTLRVWNITIRNTSDPSAFTTVFSFGQAPLAQWAAVYQGLGVPWVSTSEPMMQWLSLLQDHRTPADSIYYPNANYFTQGPGTWCASTQCRRSPEQFKRLIALGAQR
jgi:hypothetical protein